MPQRDLNPRVDHGLPQRREPRAAVGAAVEASASDNARSSGEGGFGRRLGCGRAREAAAVEVGAVARMIGLVMSRPSNPSPAVSDPLVTGGPDLLQAAQGHSNLGADQAEL